MTRPQQQIVGGGMDQAHLTALSGQWTLSTVSYPGFITEAAPTRKLGVRLTKSF
jgi:hypothetical protein